MGVGQSGQGCLGRDIPLAGGSSVLGSSGDGMDSSIQILYSFRPLLEVHKML